MLFAPGSGRQLASSGVRSSRSLLNLFQTHSFISTMTRRVSFMSSFPGVILAGLSEGALELPEDALHLARVQASQRQNSAQPGDNKAFGLHVKYVADACSGTRGLKGPFTSTPDKPGVPRADAERFVFGIDPATERPASKGPLLDFTAHESRFAMENAQTEMTGPPTRIGGDVCEHSPDLARREWKSRLVGGLDWRHGSPVSREWSPAPQIDPAHSPPRQHVVDPRHHDDEE